MSHWAAEYIGRPWQAGAQGPDAFDCWGLVRYVQQRHFARELPAVDVDAHDLRAVAQAIDGDAERASWWEVERERAQEGDCVLLAHARYPSHVGVYVEADGGGVLHCVMGAGVVFSTVPALLLSGWGRLKFYRRWQVPRN